jgi:CSLREA domain-containing protein
VSRPETLRFVNGHAALIVAALACALLALVAIPALASAQIIEVNSAGDAEKSPTSGAVCETEVPGVCTLRAAIEAANEAPANFTTIEFIESAFSGNVIEPATPLPPIEESAALQGHPILGVDGVYAPNVGLTAPAGEPALIFEADNSRVESMAIGGGEAGIEVLGESTGFLAYGNWFGLKPDGTTNPIGGSGIVLGPGSDGAVIGRSSATTSGSIRKATARRAS